MLGFQSKRFEGKNAKSDVQLYHAEGTTYCSSLALSRTVPSASCPPETMTYLKRSQFEAAAARHPLSAKPDLQIPQLHSHIGESASADTYPGPAHGGLINWDRILDPVSSAAGSI